MQNWWCSLFIIFLICCWFWFFCIWACQIDSFIHREKHYVWCNELEKRTTRATLTLLLFWHTRKKNAHILFSWWWNSSPVISTKSWKYYIMIIIMQWSECALIVIVCNIQTNYYYDDKPNHTKNLFDVLFLLSFTLNRLVVNWLEPIQQTPEDCNIKMEQCYSYHSFIFDKHWIILPFSCTP